MQKRSTHISVVLGLLIMISIAGLASSPQIRHTLLAGFTSSGVEPAADEEPPSRPAPEDLSGSLYWQPPIYPGGGNSANLDASLLDYLTVEVCAPAGNECGTVRVFNSQGTDAERLRIYRLGQHGPYYIVNWDTERANIDPALTYRIIVTMPGLELGTIDLPPSVYNTFGRTWPIKFIIENDPVLRVRLLRHLGRSASQIASVLKREFGLTAEQIAALLAGDIDPFSQAEIETALAGVFQNVVIPPTTKIADDQTGRLLSLFDPATGEMIFGAETDLLKSLRPGDVIVDEPRPAAPYGYLRKVIGKRKVGGLIYLLTEQAKLTDAISEGQLMATGELRPSPNSPLSPRLASKIATSNLDEGQQFNFQKDVDVTITFSGEEGDVEGSGTVRVQGSVLFNAGYNFGMGIEGCLEVPPVCVDRVEAWMGVEQRSRIKLTGEFRGTVRKEQIVDRVPLDPIVFFIGPVPVVLVPVVNIVIGAEGTAQVNFSFEAAAQSVIKVGAKWTDPDDNGVGWENISEFDPLGSTFFNADVTGSIRVEAYGKVDAKLLLYGLFGPGFNGSVGIGATAQIGGRPLWSVFGHIRSSVNVGADAIGFFDIGEVWSQSLIDEEFNIFDAPNQPPVFSYVNPNPISANVNMPVLLGQHFTVYDPEGELPTVTAVSNVDGPISLTPTFQTGGLRTITLTARDSLGAERTATLQVMVYNSLPIVNITAPTNTVPATVQYAVTATAYDFETSTFLGCNRLLWNINVPHTKTFTGGGGGCVAIIIFQQEGPAVVTVNATDIHGGVGSASLPVTVTAAPANSPPVISGFHVYAYRGPLLNACVPDYLCLLQPNFVIYNGFPVTYPEGQLGHFYPPLYIDVFATDANHDPLTVERTCSTGTNYAPVTWDDTYQTFKCDPIPSNTHPVKIAVSVSDGTTTVYREQLNYMFVNPN